MLVSNLEVVLSHEAIGEAEVPTSSLHHTVGLVKGPSWNQQMLRISDCMVEGTHWTQDRSRERGSGKSEGFRCSGDGETTL